jgi:hypothetical protein
MSKDVSAKPARALRLKTEARNCLTIAVQQRDTAFAGELIDEAMRLARRAQELSENPKSTRRAKFR